MDGSEWDKACEEGFDGSEKRQDGLWGKWARPDSLVSLAWHRDLPCSISPCHRNSSHMLCDHKGVPRDRLFCCDLPVGFTFMSSHSELLVVAFQPSPALNLLESLAA